MENDNLNMPHSIGVNSNMKGLRDYKDVSIYTLKGNPPRFVKDSDVSDTNYGQTDHVIGGLHSINGEKWTTSINLMSHLNKRRNLEKRLDRAYNNFMKRKNRESDLLIQDSPTSLPIPDKKTYFTRFITQYNYFTNTISFRIKIRNEFILKNLIPTSINGYYKHFD